MTSLERYDAVQDMEPLLPSAHILDGVLEKAHDLRTEATRLTGAFLHDVSHELAVLLRSMNSYYSNKIEGEHTRPIEIQRALARDFSGDADKAKLQRLALAHIQTERWLYENPKSTTDLYTIGSVQDIHAHLFGQLPTEDRFIERNDTNNHALDRVEVQPGQLRNRDVAVRRHVAPTWQSLQAMLARWCQVYGGVRRGEMQIVAAAASHHRLTWIHPFFDGNGRTARLHTLAVLQSAALTGGLWSPLRGLARSAAAYGEQLANADMPRMGDLDGRGQLSERMLVAWIDYFLDVCLDQVRFMRQMLDIGAMESRMGALLAHEEHVSKRGIRMEALRPLHYLFSTRSELPRGEFARMTGLGERTAVTLIGKLLGAGLLVSDSPRGSVRVGIPMESLRFLFPNLWPEAEADVLAGLA